VTAQQLRELSTPRDQVNDCGIILGTHRIMADWTRTAVFQRWTKDRYVADLYIWLQVNDQTTQPYQASFVTNKLSTQRPLVDGLVANLRAAPLSNMDTNWLLV